MFDFDVSSWPELPALPGVLVTAAGPRAGKTLVAGAIARWLRHAGRGVEVFQPVATGCRHDRGGLVSADADFLAACAGSRLTLAEIAPVRYAPDLSPNAAARLGRAPADLPAVFDAWRKIARLAEVVVVEAPGGPFCPITDEFWTAHLARLLRLPAIVVVQCGPGAVALALLAIHGLRSADVGVAGVVINRYRRDAADRPDVDLPMHVQPERIAALGRTPVLTLVPDDEGNATEHARLAESARFAIDQVDWEAICFARR